MTHNEQPLNQPTDKDVATGPLEASEGVNEGSADILEEGTGLAAPLGQLAGDPTNSTTVGDTETGHPPNLEAHGAPVDMESDESRAARKEYGTGQQQQVGEG